MFLVSDVMVWQNSEGPGEGRFEGILCNINGPAPVSARTGLFSCSVFWVLRLLQCLYVYPDGVLDDTQELFLCNIQGWVSVRLQERRLLFTEKGPYKAWECSIDSKQMSNSSVYCRWWALSLTYGASAGASYLPYVVSRNSINGKPVFQGLQHYKQTAIPLKRARTTLACQSSGCQASPFYPIITTHHSNSNYEPTYCFLRSTGTWGLKRRGLTDLSFWGWHLHFMINW